ncbi:hypothetical protein [Roseibium litorale]|uniref:Uncharacterized protein n=1 Tax=Roseibium litorale TaxID=2803841 RepID=A0ABR9CWB7_9HYPH|nr:hypothetical protein [Roseibium litorale]MBD8894342.1 hypothetical protein [Roseibium litorale]
MTQKSSRPQSTYRDYLDDHPWPIGDAAQNLPNVWWDFNTSRDPFIARQMDDLSKSEAERRDEQVERSSGTIKEAHPQHNLRPPRSFLKNREDHDACRAWLKEQQDRVMAQAGVGVKEPYEREIDNPQVKKSIEPS